LLSNHEETRRKNRGLKISLFAIFVPFVVQLKSMGYEKNAKPRLCKACLVPGPELKPEKGNKERSHATQP
jgi:hypothetical protein